MTISISGNAAWIVLVVLLWVGYRLACKWIERDRSPRPEYERPVYPPDADDV